MGRPVKEINWDIVENYMRAGTKNATALATRFGIQTDTFYRRFKEEYGTSFQDYQAVYQGAGVEDLRLMLYSKAMNNKAPGNPTMLMFMARCLLGMKEPETNRDLPPQQDELDKDAIIMTLKNELAEFKANANNPQTGK